MMRLKNSDPVVPLLSMRITILFTVAIMQCSLVLADSPAIDTKSEIAADNQWLGFQNLGRLKVDDARLPTTWSPTSGIAWTSSIDGYGQSTPISGHGQIVVTSTSGPNKDRCHLASFAIDSGKKQWQLDFDNPSPFEITSMVSRAAPSAIVTPVGFIALFEGGLVVATDAGGKVLWQHDLIQMYGKIEARHGLAGSLEQDKENVFVWIERTVDPFVLAIDRASGEITWKVPGLGSTSWASPRLVQVGDRQHLVCSGSGKIVGLDSKTGDRLWEFDKIANNSSCTPVPVDKGKFLIGASDGRGETTSGEAAASNGLMEIQQHEDSSFSVDYVWQAEKATCTFGSPVIAGNRALFVNRAGVLFQLDIATGKELSTARTSAGGIWATPINVMLMQVILNKALTAAHFWQR